MARNLKIVCESRRKRCFSSSDEENEDRKRFRKASVHFSVSFYLYLDILETIILFDHVQKSVCST